MDVSLRSRKTVKAGDLKPGSTFKEIQKAQCLLVIDLAQVDMFKVPPGEEGKLLLRDDCVYCVDIAIGIVGVVPKVQDVHQFKLAAMEVDEV